MSQFNIAITRHVAAPFDIPGTNGITRYPAYTVQPLNTKGWWACPRCTISSDTPYRSIGVNSYHGYTQTERENEFDARILLNSYNGNNTPSFQDFFRTGPYPKVFWNPPWRPSCMNMTPMAGGTKGPPCSFNRMTDDANEYPLMKEIHPLGPEWFETFLNYDLNAEEWFCPACSVAVEDVGTSNNPDEDRRSGKLYRPYDIAYLHNGPFKIKRLETLGLRYFYRNTFTPGHAKGLTCSNHMSQQGHDVNGVLELRNWPCGFNYGEEPFIYKRREFHDWNGDIRHPRGPRAFPQGHPHRHILPPGHDPALYPQEEFY